MFWRTPFPSLSCAYPHKAFNLCDWTVSLYGFFRFITKKTVEKWRKTLADVCTHSTHSKRPTYNDFLLPSEIRSYKKKISFPFGRLLLSWRLKLYLSSGNSYLFTYTASHARIKQSSSSLILILEFHHTQGDAEVAWLRTESHNQVTS